MTWYLDGEAKAPVLKAKQWLDVAFSQTCCAKPSNTVFLLVIYPHKITYTLKLTSDIVSTFLDLQESNIVSNKATKISETNRCSSGHRGEGGHDFPRIAKECVRQTRQEALKLQVRPRCFWWGKPLLYFASLLGVIPFNL